MPRQVLMITVDHLAPSLLGAYGRFDAQTPNLNQLAARAYLYHNAIGSLDSAAPLGDELQRCCETAGIIASQLTPPHHPPSREWTHQAIEAIRQSLTGSQPGLLWIALPGIPDPWIPTHSGWEEEVARRLGTSWAELLVDEPELTPLQAVQALADEGHFSRQRSAATPAPEADQLSLALYQACVDRLDERLGRLIREYQQHAAPESLLIVAGWAGDRLPRTWPVQRTVILTDELLHVPLLIQPGAGTAVGTAVLELVQSEDISKTVLTWLRGTTQDHHDEGLDLLAVATKQQPGRSVILRRHPGGETLIRTPTAQLVTRAADPAIPGDHPTLWLTHKPEDAWDLLNVADQNPEIVHELEQLANQTNRPGP
ncbi:MAG: hypothetical protein DWH91_09345 [Planctomycetota bacterium]|nr:MAG: hypothetical protein DWH91_09345 [Planctomycetota bacterium]